MKRKRHRFEVLYWVVGILVVFTLFFGRKADSLIQKVLYPRDFEPQVQQYAQEFGVDENIVFAIIRTESKFDPEAESKAGARGLMQITEATFSWIKSKIAPKENISFDDMYVPEVNIRFGTYLIAECLKRYDNDLPTAAAAYHSGMGKVDRLLKDPSCSENGKTLNRFPYEQMSIYVYRVNKYHQHYLLQKA